MPQTHINLASQWRRRSGLAILVVACPLAFAHAQAGPDTAKNPPSVAPQTAKPAPLPPGAGADTPDGSARNGVITPPAVKDPGINKGVPNTGTKDDAVIPPSGAQPAPGTVVPK